jgi:hypothetical protein
MALPGNPCDGHTLATVIPDIECVTVRHHQAADRRRRRACTDAAAPKRRYAIPRIGRRGAYRFPPSSSTPSCNRTPGPWPNDHSVQRENLILQRRMVGRCGSASYPNGSCSIAWEETVLGKGSGCWWGSLGALALAVGGCVTDAAETGPASKAPAATANASSNPSYAAPPGYRQMIARAIAETYAKNNLPMSRILKAEITAPANGWMGIFDGGNRPIVCARLTVKSQGLFSDQSTYVVGYTFEKGRVAGEFFPENINPALGGAVGAAIRNANTCGNLSYGPFPELMRSKGR